MSNPAKFSNPFYVVLLLAGVVFCLTASAYGVMMVRNLEPATTGAAPHPLMVFLEVHGFTTLMAELGVLAVATVGAIATDDFWAKRASARRSAKVAVRED